VLIKEGKKKAYLGSVGQEDKGVNFANFFSSPFQFSSFNFTLVEVLPFNLL